MPVDTEARHGLQLGALTKALLITTPPCPILSKAGLPITSFTPGRFGS